MDTFLSRNWGGLSWSPFVPFGENRYPIPRGGGLYRVRVAGRSLLAYIGQTGRNLRQRADHLVRGALAAEMPFNDPHTAAPRLWSYRQEVGMCFEVSAAGAEFPTRNRRGEECRLIWLYRCETGASPLCNFGRLHVRYLPPRNRSPGRRGRRLLEGEPDNDGGHSLPALASAGVPGGPGWMRLNWSDPRPLQPAELLSARGPGVYQVGLGAEVIYLGEASNLGPRLLRHCARDWGAPLAWFSYACLPDGTQRAQRLEVENDLIGAFVTQTGNLPKVQFCGEEATPE